MARLVFMGSPAFAVPTLEALAREHDIAAVYARPDRPAGRGRHVTPVPVTAWAEARGLPVHQPRSLRADPAAAESLRALTPDVVIVVAYGLILPPAILDIPPHGCLNVHASLLPRHRGAAPIPAAILAGDADTGVTILRMDAGVDTGPLLAQLREPIHADDTSLSLGERLAGLGARLMVETLPAILSGDIAPVEQDHARATVSPRIDKAAGRIDWAAPTAHIDRLVRAYTPWPGAFTLWNGALLKIARAGIGGSAAAAHDQPPGRVVRLAGGDPGVVTGDGVLELLDVQPAGKRVMAAADFARGHPQFIGSTLGDGGRST